MSCLTSSYCFCACWYNLCFFPKPWHWEGFTAFFRPQQNAVENLRVTCWNVLTTKLLTRNGSRLGFPTPCHQFSLPSLEKKHPIVSRLWDIPTSSPSSSGVSRPCWSHNEITLSKVKSCRGFLSNVLLAQSSVGKRERDCVQGARLTSVLSHKSAYVGGFWIFSIQR